MKRIMADDQVVNIDDINQQQQELRAIVSDILTEAKKCGANAAEVGVSTHTGLASTVRLGEIDKIEFNRDRGVAVTVYFGYRKGSASTSDWHINSIKETVKAACNIAKFTSEDEYSGLADSDKMATHFPELDLYHPWEMTPDEAVDIAKKCEQSALEIDDLVVNSDGATVATHKSCRVYGNSHGFMGNKVSTRHSTSCVVIAGNKKGMQRDYWYTVSRDKQDLEDAVSVGKKAGQRALSRLDARTVETQQTPVIFAAEIASGLLSHFISAISGGNLYRKSSFLLDKLGEKIFPDFISIKELPHLPKELGSAAFDGDGLATYAKDFITDGVLNNYILGTYAARKLKLQSTANSGGVHNIFISTSENNFDALLKKMQKGLLVTEVSGQGVNLVTGDYSRGAAGFWVENGKIQYPVEEITIAGNLKDMFQHIVAVGNDVDHRGNIKTGSILIENMMMAGS